VSNEIKTTYLEPSCRKLYWYINRVDSDGVQGGSGDFVGVLQNFTGPLSQNIIYFWAPQLTLVRGTLVG